MDRVDIENQVEVLARELTAMMLRRPHHHLTSLHVSCPPEIQPQALKRLVARLTEYVLRTRRPLLATPEVFQDLVAQREVELIGPGGCA